MSNGSDKLKPYQPGAPPQQKQLLPPCPPLPQCLAPHASGRETAAAVPAHVCVCVCLRECVCVCLSVCMCVCVCKCVCVCAVQSTFTCEAFQRTCTCENSWPEPNVRCVGQGRFTVLYSAYIRFWPALRVRHCKAPAPVRHCKAPARVRHCKAPARVRQFKAK
jgi:hypothetical protein